MLRYVALAWDEADQEQCRVADRLTKRLRELRETWLDVLQLNGLRVFCTGIHSPARHVHRIQGGYGLIVGDLFLRDRDIANDSPARQPVEGELSGERIFATRGRWLIDRCWGNYVALIFDRRSRRLLVLKDPTGALPAYITKSARCTVVFSRIADCLDLGLGPFHIDTAYLRARVMGLDAGLERDALENVRQIRRGECIEIDPAADLAAPTAHQAWSPFAFRGAGDLIEDQDEVAEAMRATVRACTHTWAIRHEHALLRLSGGLDSSIICGVLRDAPNRPRVVCQTLYNPQGRSDERPWARLAAGQAGWPHVEHALAPESYSLQAIWKMPALGAPTPLLGYLQRNGPEHELAQQCGATAVFTGDGGDSGFCSDSVSFAASEYAALHGLNLRLLKLAGQVALRTERTTWAVLASALRRNETGLPRNYALERISRLAAREIRRSFSPPARYPHPWLAHADQVPWATVQRLGALVCTPEPYDIAVPRADAPEVIAPLYSQPAIELFLRIPTYLHFEGGRDRGLARRAFTREVPEAIRRRLWKDRVPGFFDRVIDCHRPLLREVLLDGALVGSGWLDRSAVENALSERRVRAGVEAVEILRHLETEAWARWWWH